MTTGRINQVTIAGRRLRRASPSGGFNDGGTPRRSASSTQVGGPRSRNGKRPIRGRLAKPRTRVTNRGTATGCRAGRLPLWNCRPLWGRRKGKRTDFSLAREAVQPPTALMAGTGSGAISPPPHTAAQSELPSKLGNASAGTSRVGPARSTPAGRSAEQRLLSTLLACTALGNGSVRLPTCQSSRECSPHSSL